MKTPLIYYRRNHMRSMGKIFFLSLAAAGLFNSPAHAQTCTQINKGIASISEEIKTMQTEGISDNSAPRATMRASRMTFGAQAQANLMEYGKTLGCKFSGLKLPTSIQQQSTPAEGSSGAL
jgi:hypothetical protein